MCDHDIKTSMDIVPYYSTNTTETKIKGVFPVNIQSFVYDVTTESDFFEVNGMQSHNCRSFLHPWYDENGNPKFYGRFNQGKLVMPL